MNANSILQPVIEIL